MVVVLVGRMLLVAMIVGTSVTASATERVDAWLVISGTAGWSFVPLLQLVSGLLLVRGSRVPRTTALEGYFGTHWPWSLWVLAAHAGLLMIPWLRAHALWLVFTAAIPAAVTVRLLVGLCQQDLAMDRRRALRRVAEHQLLTLTLILIYVFLAVALWPRIVGVL